MLERLLLSFLRAAPPGGVDRLRRVGWLAPAVHGVVSALMWPLLGREVRIAEGPAAGLVLQVDRASLVWATGRVERPVQRVLAERLGPGDVFYDVGANVGFYTLLAARAVGPTGHVVAFEPHAKNIRALEYNVALNGLVNVLVVPQAVSGSSGTGYLQSGNRATARLAAAGDEVATVALDDFVAEHPELGPALVKIDVEGHETELLAGAERLLARSSPALVCELHGEPNAFVEAARRLGYRCEPVGGVALAAASHVLALPESSPSQRG
jgi:FkbM family methyltransferase